MASESPESDHASREAARLLIRTIPRSCSFVLLPQYDHSTGPPSPQSSDEGDEDDPLG